jgi:hypothetical protein
MLDCRVELMTIVVLSQEVVHVLTQTSDDGKGVMSTPQPHFETPLGMRCRRVGVGASVSD